MTHAPSSSKRPPVNELAIQIEDNESFNRFFKVFAAFFKVLEPNVSLVLLLANYADY